MRGFLQAMPHYFANIAKKFRISASIPAPPPYWRRITPDGGLASFAQRRDLILLFNARDIPFSLTHCRHKEHIYIPALLENLARKEIRAFMAENNNKETPPQPLHKNWDLGCLYTLPPLILYAFEHQWLKSPHFLPNPALWQDYGSLNGIKVLIYGQWQRVFTAIWLHAGIVHLLGNMVFGSIFLCLLARLCGAGHAWLLSCLAAALGNITSLLAHPPTYTSIGFSTVAFAALGALAGLLMQRHTQKFFTPLAASVAILAMLGTEGSNTDYAAHIYSLGFGIALGIGDSFISQKGWPMLSQWQAGALAFLLPLGAWLFTFANF